MTGSPSNPHSAARADFAEVEIRSLEDLDALVGEFVVGEEPTIRWEDAEGMFQFDSEEEALSALNSAYYQRFLPNPSETAPRRVRLYEPYSRNLDTAWVCLRAALSNGDRMTVQHQSQLWIVHMGSHATATSPTPAVAICVAALAARRIRITSRVAGILGPDGPEHDGGAPGASPRA